MKTHLPHGLRVALMAAIASVSLTSYAAATDVVVDGNYYGYPSETGTLNLTFKPGSFDRENVTRLYVLTTSHTGDVNATVQQSLLGSQSKGYYLVGMGSQISLNGSLDLRTVATGAKATNRGNVLGVDYGCTVTKDVYMGLADKNTYSGWVYGVMNSTVQGTSKLEIADGTFNGNVAVGYVNSWSNTNTILKGGTELKITNGTFNNVVAAGSVIETKSPAAAIINGGTKLDITKGTFNSTVYGGSTGAKSTINGGINVTLSGGTFNANSSVYALGSGGTVNGAVSLTIDSNAKFLGNNVISAGANGSVNYSGVTSSLVTIYDITEATSNLATDSTIKVMGGQQRSTLEMRRVRTTINAQLSQFSAMRLTWASDLTLTQATNEALGGVSSVEICNGSTLTLQNDAEKTWDLSGVKLTTLNEGLGTLKKTGAGKLTIGDTSAFGGGALSVLGGELTLSGATNAQYLTVASGATLSVKEGNLFAAGAGAGSTISINNGATLAANEGTWTLNKAATIENVAISGKAAVALGSEVDNAAVVTMSGTIDATAGNLILKNTAIAADTTATLSGNLTFEGAVDNKGTLSIADGSTINVDEESLIRNGHFVHNGDKTAKNGFFADSEISLTTGNNFSVNKDNVTLSLDGVASDKLGLSTDGDTLSISGFADLVKGTYFVNEGNVSYTEIKTAGDQKLTAIAVGNNGKGDTHQLTLDTALADGVTIISASDNAKVSVNEGVVLNASQTAIKGEANEVHVVGDGSVLMDDTSKLSQLAGTATMTLKDTATTFNSEAKMTGALVVANGQTLTVEDGGSIASFSSVQMGGTEAKLTSEVGSGKTDSIQSISGSGTLAKTGDGKLTVTDAKDFSGDMEVSGGTLQVEDADLMQMHKERKITVSNRAVANLTKLTTGATVKALDLDGTLGVYTGETADEGNVGSLTVTGALTISGEGSKLEANLTLDSGSIFDVSAGYSLELGCTLTMNDNLTIVLSDTQKTALAAGDSVELMTGVDALTGTLPKNFTIKDYDGPEAQFVYSGTTLSLSQTPEPTTTTLSLLALAALAARRKRK